MSKQNRFQFTAGEAVTHKGNKWIVVGMVGQGLVKIRRGEFSRTIRVNQVRRISDV